MKPAPQNMSKYYDHVNNKMVPFSGKISAITAKELAQGKPISLAARRSTPFNNHKSITGIKSPKMGRINKSLLGKSETEKLRPISPDITRKRKLATNTETMEDVLNDIKSVKQNYLLYEMKLKGTFNVA